MKSSRYFAMLATLGLVFCSAPVLANSPDDPADVKAVQAELAELRAEVQQLRDEMKALQADLTKTLAELNAVKAAQKAATQPKPRPAMDMLGKPAPAHTFKTAEDKELTIGGTSDTVKVVCFYATWCGYCKRALPGFEKLHNEYKDKGVEVIAISLDDRTGNRAKTPEQIMEHYKGLQLTLPMHMDEQKKIGGSYKVSSFPTSFVLGKNGKVEAVHVGGPVDLDKTIAAEIDQLLAGKSLLKETAAVETK